MPINPLQNTFSSPTSYQNTSGMSAPYVSPTYRSTIFNHTQTFTPTGREARHAINPLGSAFRDTMNNPNKANTRAVFDVRMMINEEYQRDMANVEKKKQEVIQRKKPTSDDIKSFESFQSDYQKMMLKRKTDIRNEKVNYGKELVNQMEERSRRRTLEIQEMKELGQKVHGLSLSVNVSPVRDAYSSVGNPRRRDNSQGKTEESGSVKYGKTFESQSSSRMSERSKEVRRTQLPYGGNFVVAQTVRGQGSLDRIINKAMRSPKGNSSERRPILDKDRSPTRDLTQIMKVKAEKPTQLRVQSAKKLSSRDQRPPSTEKTAVAKRQQENKNGDGFNPLLKDKPVTVNKNTRMRRSATNFANQQQDDLEQMQAGPEIEYDREAVNSMRRKKLEQISKLTGSIGKQSEVILDVIDEDPSLQFNDEDEGQISISSKRHQSEEKDEPHTPRIMDLKGFFGSKTHGTEARTLESDRVKENPDSLSRRDSNSDNTEQKDILEALMEKRKDLLSYLRGLKGRLSYTANKRENQKEYGQGENQKPQVKVSKVQRKSDSTLLAKQKLLQQGRSTTVKPINELIMAQILERQKATETEKKAKMEESEEMERYKGYEPSYQSTDVFNKQMRVLQQYKKNMKFFGYPENYSSAGQSSKMI